MTKMMMKITRISLRHVQYIPKELEPGVLYVADEYGAAAHLCPCGCGSKIRTPLHPTEWSLEETASGPTLFPSVGNWQQPCRSHYWIEKGVIRWSNQWTEKQILAGRRGEEQGKNTYYYRMYEGRGGLWGGFWQWAKGWFTKLVQKR